jgi:hypothetical protein
MGDKDHGQPQLAFEPLQQVHDLRLGGGVKRTQGLIGDEQLRMADQCLGDRHALALASAELVRIGPHDPLGLVKPNFPQDFPATIRQLRAAQRAMGLQHVQDLPSQW